MPPEPIITVAIPVYNEDKYLPATIESVLGQTLSNFRLIISDNCSTDRTFEFASAFEKKDSRIKVYRQKENIGIARNFKFASDKADTKYFVWLGAHDQFMPDFLERAVSFLEANKNVMMAYSDAEWIDPDNKVMKIIEEDIDTRGLSRKDALIKIMENTDIGIETHGVFVTSALQSVPFAMDVGLELLLFFVIATMGDIAKLGFTGLKFREMRKETVAQRMKRYKEIKIIESPTLFTIERLKKHLSYTWKSRDMSLADKLIVSSIVTKKIAVIYAWMQYRSRFSDRQVQTVK